MVNYDMEVLAEDVKWFIQYSGWRETTAIHEVCKQSYLEEVHESKAGTRCSSRWGPTPHYVQVCGEEKKFQGAGYVEVFGYDEYNEELNTEDENIRLLNTEFLTYCIVYTETNEHTKTTQERAAMLEHDYKIALQRVKVIVDEAKEARHEALSRKKQIREGKRNDRKCG